jgi:hypothetical protein
MPEGVGPKSRDDTCQALEPVHGGDLCRDETQKGVLDLAHRPARSGAGSQGLTRSLSWDLAGY